MASAGEILRRARAEAGMTLRRLARESGVAESRLSDYEHGRHQPSAARLQRLLDATGHDLVAQPRPRLHPARNGRIFADVLSLVDALPAPAGGRAARSRDRLPTWAELTDPGRAG